MRKNIGSAFAATAIVLGSLPNLTVFAATHHTSTKQIQEQSEIVVNGQSMPAMAVVQNHTVWLPVSTLQQAISQMGLNVSYNGQQLLIDNLALQSATLSTPPQGKIDIAAGSQLMRNVPVVQSSVSGQSQTYVPIWYVNKAISQADTGYLASWNGGNHTLTLTNDKSGPPSVAQIDQVMAATSEVGTSGEHFAISGKPVTITADNGDSVTAVVGTRSPSADGYGQVVFFFHNQTFVGVDSDTEKTDIRSVKPAAAGMSFEITYANYAETDPLSSPSLAPVTVEFGWGGTSFTANQTIPSGALNGMKISVSSAQPAQNTPGADAKAAIQAALPVGAKLVNRPGVDTPYLAVDFNGDGEMAYAAAYKVKSIIGAVVVGEQDGKWQPLWQKNGLGVSLAELNAGDVTGDGSTALALQAYVGDGANETVILKWLNGKLQPIFDTAALADIGDFDGQGGMEIATWQHDTGPLENIQMYAWDAQKQAYAKANNADYPTYFANNVIPYYQALAKQKGEDAVPPKMLDYGLAGGNLAAGFYQQALEQAQRGLQQGANAYPPNGQLQTIEQAAEQALQEQKTYYALSPALKAAIQAEVSKYTSGLLNPMAAPTILVDQTANGYKVHTVGGMLHNDQDGVMQYAHELSFTISSDGKQVTNVAAQDSLGNTVW
ncbi:LppP/LprE family lipoprotein [Alicyclobacillus fodiniaquatilis]|uniref:LppP/LprE family lipoprotein n=1 Tax=Alicyclobacillus fodiniaquatilis TaxID=1661150 RepID=A0ABW4JGT6_9BACL